MKLLIVDDESLTREGLITSINWTELGISKIYEANDGVNGKAVALDKKPDIILCDIRMPRMTGIELVESLSLKLPSTSFIFMSGYSDKEYLKAAIKLKAISYVEKPINKEEIVSAILEAKEQQFHLQSASLKDTFIADSVNTQLANYFTKPYHESVDYILPLLKNLPFQITDASYFTTYILKPQKSLWNFPQLDSAKEAFQELAKHYNTYSLYTSTHSTYHIFFLVGTTLLSPRIKERLGLFLIQQFQSFTPVIASACSCPKSGLTAAYQSYASAALGIQQGYFYPTGSLIQSSDADSFALASQDTDAFQTFHQGLQSSLQDKLNDETYQSLDNLYALYHKSNHLLPNQVKDNYFQLFSTLRVACMKAQLNVEAVLSSTPLLEQIESCLTYQDLHDLLIDKCKNYYANIHQTNMEDPTIFLIKEYIGKNYSNIHLSLKDISSYVHLSVSYMCTFFKTQTGTTLNQYITDYRMETAKQLLEDARNPIADISTLVGYSNSNYFGKSFKKYTGFSPSQFREVQ